MDALRHPSLTVRYRVPASHPDWTLSEEPMPESQPHDLVIDLLKALLVAWVARAHLDAQVARNLAVRWDEAHPNIGIDPDLCVITPRTPEGDDLTSLRTWCEGHTAPRLAIEVVSESNPRKDYRDAPDRYAELGADELVIFDADCDKGEDRVRWQRYRRLKRRGFVRVESTNADRIAVKTLGCFLRVVGEGDGARLRIGTGPAGDALFPTEAEAERVAKEAALREVAELRALLAKKGGKRG